MPVSPTLRQIEHEIDQVVCSHDLFKVQRDRLLLALLDYYRDAIEVVFCRNAHARQFGLDDELQAGLAIEGQMHLGILQTLKWAMEFASADSDCFTPDLYQIAEFFNKFGPAYVAFADSLKMAKYNRSWLEVDESTRTITVYEGGDVTGADVQLVSHQHATLPFRSHLSFVEDADQLTAQWTAGDFRRLTERLHTTAADAEKESIISTFGGAPTHLFHRPALDEIPDADSPAEQAALQDLTLTVERVRSQDKWTLGSWFDAPFVMIGPKRMGVSNVIKTLAASGREGHMLRVAVQRDAEQYQNVS